MMVEHGVRGIDNEVAALTQAEAQVNIVVGNVECLVESFQLFKHGSTHHQACRRHRAEVSNNPGKIVVSGMIAGKTPKGVSRFSVNPNDNTGMLNRPVGKEQSCPYRANFGSL